MLRGVTAQEGVGPPVIGKLQRAIGSVIVTRANHLVVDFINGDRLCRGDRIETGPDGLATILFADGTSFQIYANADVVIGDDTRGAEAASVSALIRIGKGAFRFFTGKTAALDAGPIVDTPFARIRGVAPGASFGSVAFGILTFGLIHELKAASSNLALRDDEPITYKDLKHGVFVIIAKGQVIVVDDPGVSVVVQPNGSFEHVVNSLSQMAQIEHAYDGVSAVYSLGRQDPFIQNFQPGANPNEHANATEPHST